MRAITLFLVLCAASVPVFGHDILRSEASVRAQGTRAIAGFTINLFELTDPIVPGSPRATVSQLDSVVGSVFDSVQRHVQVGDPAAPVRITRGEYTLIDGNVIHLKLVYDFPREVRTIRISSTLFEIMPPGHKLFVTARLNGVVRQAILDSGTTTASFTGTRVSAWDTLRRFSVLGIEHIFTGYDHLAFLLGLLVATATLGSLVKIVTSFTIAHSITLALATFQLVVLPSRLTESLIAVSIAWVAAENLLNFRLMRRHYVTFLFGLIHGFGFSNVLRDMDLPASGLALSLFSFNLGVELGQITFVALIFPLVQDLAANGWTKLKPVVSACIACLAVYWFVQRAFLL